MKPGEIGKFVRAPKKPSAIKGKRLTSANCNLSQCCALLVEESCKIQKARNRNAETLKLAQETEQSSWNSGRYPPLSLLA